MVILPDYHIIGNYMFKVSNVNTRTRCELCSKLTLKIPEQRQWCAHSLHLVVVGFLLTLSK